MSFNPPRNTPSFNTDRTAEDTYWRQQYKSAPGSSNMSSSYAYPHARNPANGHTTKSSLSTEHLKGKLGDFLGGGSARELPLYKDKPQFTTRNRNMLQTIFPGFRRKRWLVLGVVLFLLWWCISSLISWLNIKEVSWTIRRNMVRNAFLVSWDDYATFAWGKDTYSPIARKGEFLVYNPGPDHPASTGLGWIIVDGLDTAIMMNCSVQVAQARQWIQTSLHFGTNDGDINTFETTIRILGGLLSAHYLSTTFPHLAPQRDDDWGEKGEDLYIEKAVDLADRLLGAFDTPTRIPYSSVNLNTSSGIPSKDVGGLSSTAEATSLQLELKYVSKVTGEPLYWTTAEKTMEAVDAPRADSGLVPIFINPTTGEFAGHSLRLGSRGDSYYEYLLKQYLQTGEKIYKEMWDEALEGIKRHMITWSPTADFTVLAERPGGLQGAWSGKMDHLTCFLPAVIALGVTGGLSVSDAKKQMGDGWGRRQEEDLLLAEELMKTCWGMYVITPTGLAAEITYLKIDDPPRRWNFDDSEWQQPRSQVDFADLKGSAYTKTNAPWRSDFAIQPQDVHHLQRPETAESLFYLWRITGNTMYREWGWRMFKSFSEHTKVVSGGKITGYTSLASVMEVPPPHLKSLVADQNLAHHMAKLGKLESGRDNMEGFWLSETLKYLYLLFSDHIKDEWFDLSKVVINTEGHFFPRFNITGHNAFKTGWSRKERPGS